MPSLFVLLLLFATLSTMPAHAANGTHDLSTCADLLAKMDTKAIFNQSQSRAVMSDALVLTADDLQLPEFKHTVFEAGEEIYKWEAYFFGDAEKKTFVSAPEVLGTLKANMLTIRLNQRKYGLGGRIPHKIIFINDEVELFTTKGILAVKFPGYVVTPDNSQALGSMVGLRIKDKSGTHQIPFDEESNVIVIGTGRNESESMWNSPFITAHEMAHNSEFYAPMNFFGFFKEARADFLAYLMTRSFTNFALDDAGFRHVVVANGKSIDELFENRKTIDKYQLSSLFSHLFYEVFRVLEKRGEGRLINSYLAKSIQGLTVASPWYQQDTKTGTIKVARSISTDQFTRPTAIALLSDIASSFMQEAAERQVDLDIIYQIGKLFEDMGAQGPYTKKGHFYDDESPIQLGPKQQVIFSRIPMTWNSAEDLRQKLKSHHRE